MYCVKARDFGSALRSRSCTVAGVSRQSPPERTGLEFNGGFVDQEIVIEKHCNASKIGRIDKVHGRVVQPYTGTANHLAIDDLYCTISPTNGRRVIAGECFHRNPIHDEFSTAESSIYERNTYRKISRHKCACRQRNHAKSDIAQGQINILVSFNDG